MEKNTVELSELMKDFQTRIDTLKTQHSDDVKTQLTALKTELEEKAKTTSAADAETIKTIKAQLEDVNETINQIKEKGMKGGEGETMQKQIHNFIEENFDTIKNIHSQKHGLVEFEVKAVGTVTTQNATTPTAFPGNFGAMIAPPGNVNLRGTIIEGLVSKVKTSLAVYPYTETVPKDGKYEFVGEGKVKPQMDFTTETRYATPKKIAAWIKLTDESVRDIVGLQSIANDLLKKKHDLFKEKGLLFGDGTGDNAKGATLYGRAFVAGAMAGKVANPNIMDVINAGVTNIYTTHNYEDETPYEANSVLINPIDFFLDFVSAKTADGLPLYPTASLFKFVVIGGITIMPFEAIPQGKIFIADLSKYNITDWVGYTVKIGWVNDDFIKNQFVILGESRFHAFVKKLDEQAFIYDDIATIKTAIAAPAPAGKTPEGTDGK